MHLIAEHMAEHGDRRGAVELLQDYLAYTEKHHAERKTGIIHRLIARIRSGELEMPDGEKRVVIPRFPPVFVGRGEDLQKMQHAWNALGYEPTRTLLLTGASGMGKTSTGNKFAQFLNMDGQVVLRATCQAVAREIPFATVTSLVEDMCDDPELGATDPHWLSEASRIAPSLRTRYPGVPEPQPYPGETIRLTIAESFYQLVTTVAVEKRICIILDDIENIDPASRDVLTVLVRRPRPFGVLLIGTTRTQSPEDPAAPTDFARDFEWTDRVELVPLSDEAIEEQLKPLAAADGDGNMAPIERIVRLAGGSPRYAELLFEDWKMQGERSLASLTSSQDNVLNWQPPSSVREAFERRRGRNRDSVLEMAEEVLAVAGEPTPMEIVGEIIGHRTSRLAAAFAAGIGGGTIELVEGRPTLRNRAHAAFVYAGLSDGRCALIHAQLARCLADDNNLPARNQAAAVHHFLRSGDRLNATNAALSAARAAVERGAPAEAEQLLKRVSISDSDESDSVVQLDLADVLCQQSKYLEAREHLALAGTWQSEHELRALHLNALVSVRGSGNIIPDAVAALDSYLNRATQASDFKHMIDALQLKGELAVDACDWGVVDAMLPKVTDLLPRLGTDLRGRGQLLAGFVFYVLGRPVDAYIHFQNASAQLTQPRDVNWLLRALNGLGGAAHGTGNVQVALETFNAVYSRAVTLGNDLMACNAANNAGTTNLDLGDLDAASRWLHTAESHAANRHSRYETLVRTNLAELYVLEGRPEEALLEADRALQIAVDANVPQWIANALFCKADVCVANGESSAAAQMISQAQTTTKQPDQGYPRGSPGFATPHMNRHLRYLAFWEGRKAEALASPFSDQSSAATLATFIELVGFVEWASAKEGVTYTPPLPCKAMVAATGFHGVELRLKRLGMWLDAGR